MKLVSYTALVGTVASPVVSFLIERLHSVRWRADGAMEWGMQNVSVGGGDPLSASEFAGYTHLDFRQGTRGLVEIFGVAAVATTCRVVVMMED